MLVKDKNIEDWSTEWLNFKKGDPEAFHKIYDFFFDRLYSYGRKLTGQTSLLEDCIQELFLKLYTNRNNLSETDNLEFYLLKALKLTIYGKLRNERRFLNIDEPSGYFFQLEFELESETYESDADVQLEIIKKYLETLNPKSRELLYLKFYTNLNYSEIGKMMGIQPSSVKKRVYRIMLKIKSILTHEKF